MLKTMFKSDKKTLIPPKLMNTLRNLVNTYVENKEKIDELEKENTEIKERLEEYVPDEGLIIDNYIITCEEGRILKSVDYEKLQKDYPDVYKALVKFRKGNPYIKIGKNTGNYSLYKKK